MISYKEYKQLQESFFGLAGGTLGVTSPQSLGLMGAHTDTKSAEEMLDEAKKKAKKMLAGCGTGQATDDGDGEVVKPSAVKDADVDADDDAPKGDGADDDDENLDPEAMDGPKFSKKKMSADDKCSECHQSPCVCSDVKKKFKEAMMEEMESEFFASLRSMMAPPKPRDFSPVSEEILFNPSDPNFGLVAQDASEPVQTVSEPSPGEVGFSPEGRLGDPLGGYSESVKKK